MVVIEKLALGRKEESKEVDKMTNTSKIRIYFWMAEYRQRVCGKGCLACPSPLKVAYQNTI